MGEFGYQKQRYGMCEEAQQQSYAMNPESSWKSRNKNYQSHGSGMQMKPNNMYTNDTHLMKHQAMFDKNPKHNGYWDGSNSSLPHNTHHSLGGNKVPTFGGGFNAWHGGKLNNHEMENSNYERFHEEEIHAPTAVRVQEMRYEPSSWGSDHDHAQMENSNYERFHKEDIHASAAVRVQEMRYEPSSWGYDHDHAWNNYHRYDDDINWNKNRGQYEWVSKGV